MEIVDFSFVVDNDIHYGGDAGSKLGFVWNEENWFLKFPKPTKSMQINKNQNRNVLVSYTTSPLSEYIGSHIYDMLGCPVHETILGEKDGKIVVACKDFRNKGDILEEFKAIKNAYDPNTNEDVEMSSGSGVVLEDILKVVKDNRTLNKVEGVEERFWNMFVIDAFIANNDRNNGNWGVLRKYDGSIQLAPVYDNGNSFDNKGSDEKFVRIMQSEDALLNSVILSRKCTYVDENGKAINPLNFIQSMKNAKCNEAVKEITEKIDLEKICRFIDSIPTQHKNIQVISPVRKEFYKKSLKMRYELVLSPVYEKIRAEACIQENSLGIAPRQWKYNDMTKQRDTVQREKHVGKSAVLKDAKSQRDRSR